MRMSGLCKGEMSAFMDGRGPMETERITLSQREILSVRVGRQVVDDHTVSWDGNRRWKSNGVWMARTGYASAAATCACAIAPDRFCGSALAQAISTWLFARGPGRTLRRYRNYVQRAGRG